ncbi:MAG: hypothetical protein QMC23_11580 [Rubritalea sp.]
MFSNFLFAEDIQIKSFIDQGYVYVLVENNGSDPVKINTTDLKDSILAKVHDEKTEKILSITNASPNGYYSNSLRKSQISTLKDKKFIELKEKEIHTVKIKLEDLLPPKIKHNFLISSMAVHYEIMLNGKINYRNIILSETRKSKVYERKPKEFKSNGVSP